jgi:hypothetical protein
VQIVASEAPVHQLDATQFEDAVAGPGIQAGCFSIEDKLTHVELALPQKLQPKK